MPTVQHNAYTTTPVRLPKWQPTDLQWLTAEDRRRFWAKVARADSTACWLWTASTMSGNCRGGPYGQFTATTPGGTSRKQLHLYAHRVAWALSHGPIPEGLQICHRCDTPLCCNPAHLFLGTHTDNMQDASRKGRLAIARQRTRGFKGEVIQRYLAGGITASALGAAYGVCQMTVLRWVRAETGATDLRSMLARLRRSEAA